MREGLEASVQRAPSGPFQIVGAKPFEQTELGQLRGRFTVEIPPGSGLETPLTIIANTEQEIFVQIAAFAKQFEGMDRAKATAHMNKLKEKGWMRADHSVPKSSRFTVRALGRSGNYEDIVLKGADYKAVLFFWKLYGSQGNAEEVSG